MSDPSNAITKPRESYAFLVWRKAGRPPRKRHETLAEATKEAERLAHARPGASFLVMQELVRITVPNPAAIPAQPVEPGGTLPPASPGSPSQDPET